MGTQCGMVRITVLTNQQYHVFVTIDKDGGLWVSNDVSKLLQTPTVTWTIITMPTGFKAMDVERIVYPFVYVTSSNNMYKVDVQAKTRTEYFGSCYGDGQASNAAGGVFCSMSGLSLIWYDSSPFAKSSC